MEEHNSLSSTVVFWGARGWALGLQFRDWRVGGGQNRHAGLTGGHSRDGSHIVDVGVALGGGARRRTVVPLHPPRPSGHPGVTHSSAATRDCEDGPDTRFTAGKLPYD